MYEPLIVIGIGLLVIYYVFKDLFGASNRRVREAWDRLRELERQQEAHEAAEKENATGDFDEAG